MDHDLIAESGVEISTYLYLPFEEGIVRSRKFF